MPVKKGRLEKTPENLLALYESMVRIRVFEDVAMERYKQGDIPGFMHLYQGEEAVAAGVCAVLSDGDVVTSTHRGHGHAVAKGIPARECMAELAGKEGGCSRGRGGSMHMYKKEVGFLGTNGLVGGGIGMAVGAALTIKIKRQPHVGVAFFGDGASNMGVFYESLNLASKMALPVLFVCENNQYATSTALADVAANPEIASRAAAFNMPGKLVDGNDVMAVYEAAAEAKERALAGCGPTLIECRTYRYGGHHIGDQMYGTYRVKEEVDTWHALRDPITNYKKRLTEVYGITEQQIADVDARVQKEIDEAVAYSIASPLPDPATVEDDLFWRECK
jgi:TPP-dependent pyruvate/acetoin dehydrogenase alpha subunit